MTEDEFTEWKVGSLTQEIFEILNGIKELYVDKLKYGHTLESPAETARCVGRIEAFDYLLNIQYKDSK